MRYLVRWHEELSPFGLVIVAPHVQAGAAEKVRGKAQSLGIPFAVTAGGSVAGAKITGIPHTFLFDHEGACVFEGHPQQAEAKLRSAVGKALVERTGKSTFNKSVQPLADALRKGAAPAQILGKTIPLQKTNDDAKAMIEALTATGKKHFDDAQGMVDDDPITAYFQVQRLSTIYKGTPVGAQAGELLGKLKNDKKVTTELKARPSLEQVKKVDAYLTTAGKGVDPAAPEFQKAFSAQLKQLKGTVQKMKTSWPDTRATLEAVEVAEKYGVTIK